MAELELDEGRPRPLAVASPSAAPEVARRPAHLRPATPEQRDARTAPLPAPPLPVIALLRHRLPWLVVAAVLGAALGLAAASGSTYEATSVLRLEPGTADGVRAQQQAQTLEQVVTSTGVLEAAAADVGADVDDLRARTRAVWQQGTSLVDVIVASDTLDAAVAGANAVAGSAVEVGRLSAADRSRTARAEADRVLDGEQLNDATAEEARRARLGSATADAQAEAVASSGAVTVISTATTAVDAGLSQAVGLVLGTVGAVLLAGAIAIAAGVRGLRPRHSGELARLAPDLDVRPASSAADLAAVLVETERSPLVVIALAGAEQAADDLAARIAARVRALGREVALLPEGGAAASSEDVLAALRPRSGPGALRVLSVSASSDAAALARGRADLVVALLAPRGTAVRTLRRAVTPLHASPTAVVLVP